MEQNYTIPQVIEFTINMLKDINVPMAYFESIGVPIARSIGNLEKCQEAMKAAEQENGSAQVQAADDNEPIELKMEEDTGNGNADA